MSNPRRAAEGNHAETRLSRVCDAIIEAGWLTALVTAPLFFNTFSVRVFEPDKLHLVRSIALVLAVAWVIRWLDAGSGSSIRKASPWSRLVGTPLALPTLVLVASYLISTALSVVPRISLFGSYVRMQGALSFLSYVVMFAMVLTRLHSRAQVGRLIYAAILTSLPISIYGIIQSMGLDPLPWGGDVRERVAANMGNAIFVAAYLIMVVFLTLERLVDSLAALFGAEERRRGSALRAAAYLVILIIQCAAIVLTQSRGPWMGLVAGLYVFAMVGLALAARRTAAPASGLPAVTGWLARHARGARLGLIGLSLAGLAFVVVLNVPAGPLRSLCEKRYVARLCTLTNTTEGTNAVRVLIWEGVVNMMLRPHAPIEKPDGAPDRLNPIRPLIGYGPESLWVAYNRFYPPDLAHYESRNASPDRSHNETFDTLVRGGIVQFAAQIALFGSIFYYSLRWLGLMRSKGQRRLFLALLATGGAAGVLLPLWIDGSLRLAGIGAPAGLIAGVIAYVTLEPLASATAGRTDAVPAGQLPDRATAGRSMSGRRQLLILALLAAIVAHFVEVHFGIAIASTLTHLWIFSALLVVVGLDRLDRPEEATVLTTKPARPNADARATAGPSALRAVLPYALIGALITLVLVWIYTVDQTGADGPLAVLWNAFAVRVSNYRIIASPALPVLLLTTWLIGALLAVTEGARERQPEPARHATALTRPRGRPTAAQEPRAATWAPALAAYLGIALATFLGYGLVQAARLSADGFTGLAVFRHIAAHIVVFDILLLVMLLLLAAAIVLADKASASHAAWPARTFGSSPLLSLGGGLALAGAALVVIANVNIRSVQADAYYKQGLAYENAGQWESAVVLYREAAKLQPQEDYYALFLGRALLQWSESAPEGDALLPEDLDDVATDMLPDLIQRGLRSGSREDALRSAHAALVAAQRLNPLSTDHTANLARLYRAWAFADAGSEETAGPGRLRAIVATRPQDVDLDKLRKAEETYRQAVSLSPQNASLWNELATAQFIRGDLEGAQDSLSRSLLLDKRFYSTYVLQGDLLDAAGDREGALAAYEQAARLAPDDLSVLSALGVASAQAGATEAALDAFEHIVEVEMQALDAAQSEVARLDATAAQAGGYDRLQAAASNRRSLLEGQAAGHRSQIHLAHRNLALVLRDAGRTADALKAALLAGEYAGVAERSTIDALIAELKGLLDR